MVCILYTFLCAGREGAAAEVKLARSEMIVGVNKKQTVRQSHPCHSWSGPQNHPHPKMREELRMSGSLRSMRGQSRSPEGRGDAIAGLQCWILAILGMSQRCRASGWAGGLSSPAGCRMTSPYCIAVLQCRSAAHRNASDSTANGSSTVSANSVDSF
jgi:hypothetical protein